MTVTDLSRAATAHVQRAAKLTGIPLATRGTEKTRAAALERIEAAAKRNPAALRQWRAACDLWWRMAMSERRMARGEAGRFQGFPQDELTQEALIGLFRAAQRWDPERDVKYRSFGRWWARAALTRSVDYTQRPIRVSGCVAYALVLARRVAAELEREGLAPTPERVQARLVGVEGRSHVGAALRALSVLSLEAPVTDSDGELRVGDILAADGPTPDDIVDDRRREARLRAALDALPVLQRQAIEGFAAGDPGHAIARRLHTGRESVRRARHQAQAALTAAMEAA